MYNLDNTEKQYAFQFFDYSAEKDTLRHGNPHLIETRKELINLVNDGYNSANFWHTCFLDLAKEIMLVAGLPDDFKEHGTDEAFDLIRSRLSK
jgi:hypothetical protein